MHAATRSGHPYAGIIASGAWVGKRDAQRASAWLSAAVPEAYKITGRLLKNWLKDPCVGHLLRLSGTGRRTGGSAEKFNIWVVAGTRNAPLLQNLGDAKLSRCLTGCLQFYIKTQMR